MEEIQILEVVIRKKQDKSNQEIEDTNKNQRSRKLPGICKFSQKVHLELQSYSKIIEQVERKEGMGMDRETPMGIQGIKKKIISQPILSLPKREGKFRVETDISEHAIGRVLLQEQEEKWKLIAFLSRTMQPAEVNYEIHDKELLVIVEALTKWRQYLLDTTEKFEVWTDHENLKYFREPQKLNG